MQDFTTKIVHDIKNSVQTYKHDNLTTTECPTCGKFMIKVKTKNGQMLVCQDPSCKTKKNVQRKTNARCPNCKKKMTLFGKGKEATYRCICGYTSSDEKLENNPFKDALKNLKL